MAILFALIFYGVFSLFTFIGLPLISRWTSRTDLAYGISKVLGLALCAYVVWLGALLKVFDYQNRWLIRGVAGLLILAGVVALLRVTARPTLKGIAGIELASFALYGLFLLVRSTHPSAEGTEHFMDMALLSAAGKTHSFPFVDPWYAGKLVNYYYYGSYIVSLISNLGGVPYATAYNLALGLIYSQTALLAGVLTFALTGLKRFGVLAAFLVTTAGTLFYGQCAIGGALATPATTCAYMSSTRLYDPSYIINEIPSYSFTVGNLHAHVLALPFFLAGLTLIYIIGLSARPTPALYLLLAISLATSAMINSWDVITLFCVLGLLTLLKLYQHRLRLRLAARWAMFGLGAIVAVGALVSPALAHFENPVLGVGFSPGYVASHGLQNVQYPTPFGALVGIWGAFLVAVLLASGERFGAGNLPFLRALTIASIAILCGIELFFIKDLYSLTNPPYFRANTTFKFGYHVWVMLSIVFAACIASLMARRGPLRMIAATLCLLVIAGGVAYPIEAIRQYYWSSGEPRGLDASAWMQEVPGDRDVVHYINNNIRERSVIAEAVGESYSRHGRITTFTGMIAPLGWQWHEWTWRFRSAGTAKVPLDQLAAASWAPVSITAQNIARLYACHDPQEAKRLIDLYGIQYVYVGDLERESYPDLDESKFQELGRVVFESNGARLFAVR